jgi:hypothetical protein
MKLLSIFVLLLGFSQVSSAQDYVPYGMAGCGLWSQVINGSMKNNAGSQSNELIIVAARYIVLNSQTTSITSGLMNCVEGRGHVSQAVEQEVFVSVNLPSLQQETAQGGGEHLNAFAEILGCKDKSKFAKFSKKNYRNIFNSKDPKTVLNGFRTQIGASDMASQCSRAS